MNLQHLAYEYGKQGARLALSSRRENALRQVADKARDCGSPDVIIVRADVSKVEDCMRMIDETVNHFGRCKNLIFYHFFFFSWVSKIDPKMSMFDAEYV